MTITITILITLKHLYFNNNTTCKNKPSYNNNHDYNNKIDKWIFYCSIFNTHNNYTRKAADALMAEKNIYHQSVAQYQCFLIFF